MTNQPNTGPRQDSAKKRREYLRKKAAALILLFISAMFGVLLLVVTAVVVSMARHGLGGSGLWIYIWAGFACLSLTVLGVFLFYGSVTMSRQASSLLYIPPVAEQIAALPAEAILVRGSDQPSAAPGELLRAARAGEMVDEAGELLRADQGAKETR